MTFFKLAIPLWFTPTELFTWIFNLATFLVKVMAVFRGESYKMVMLPWRAAEWPSCYKLGWEQCKTAALEVTGSKTPHHNVTGIGKEKSLTYCSKSPALAVEPSLAGTTWSSLPWSSTVETTATWAAFWWSRQSLFVTVSSLWAGLRFRAAFTTIKALQDKVSLIQHSGLFYLTDPPHIASSIR